MYMSDLSESTIGSWSDDIHQILHNILHNCDTLQQRHRSSYLLYESRLAYFRIPLICLAAINSVFSVGLQIFLSQNVVSTTNCLISLTCACISAVELFLGVYKRMEQELGSYHGYKLLGVRVSAMLKLDPAHREGEGTPFLNSVLAEYTKLFESSLVLTEKLTDELFKFEALGKKSNPILNERSPNSPTSFTSKQVPHLHNLQGGASDEC